MPRPKNDYVRYMCQFTPVQYSKLKKASEDGFPISFLVRKAVENFFEEQELAKNIENKENSLNNSKENNKNISETKNGSDKYDLIDSLEKLINLKNRGEISEKEYEIFKSKLIEI